MPRLRPLHERLREAREQAGLSQPELFRRTEGIGYETIRGVEAPPGNPRHRYPSPEVLAAYLQGVGVDPYSFPEYRLAEARKLLDERAVDPDVALANLALVAGPLGIGDGGLAADTADQIAARAALEASLGDAARRADGPPRASPGTRRVPRARRGPGRR